MKARLLAPLALAAACSAEPAAPPEATPVDRVREPDVPAHHPEVPDLAVRARGPRRMSVAQIERSLDVIGNFPAGSIEIPADLALTLGEPDYDRVIEESLEPSPLFMKFMMDLGGIFCAAVGDAEARRPAEERVFTRHEAVPDNLRHMLLRFTGIEGEDAAPYLERLRRVHDAGEAGARPYSGYEAACIALFTSPEFLLY